MYYTFSGFTQRLTGAASSSPYIPQGLRSNIPSESPTIIFATPTKVLSQSSPAVEYMGVNKVPDLQRIFQVSDEIPVHLKRGVPDRLLYRTTMALTVGGALYCLVALYIIPKINELYPDSYIDLHHQLANINICKLCKFCKASQSASEI